MESRSTAIEIPESIVRVFQRAISARRRCAAWFQKTGGRDEDGSTARHVHFVRVLERALSVLVPSARANLSPPKPKEATSTMEEPSHQLANRFGPLDVEDLDESLDVAASEVVLADKKHSAASMCTGLKVSGRITLLSSSASSKTCIDCKAH